MAHKYEKKLYLYIHTRIYIIHWYIFICNINFIQSKAQCIYLFRITYLIKCTVFTFLQKNI